MDLITPYFMTNKNWYKFTKDGIVLSDEGKKILKVLNSYNQYLKDIMND